MSSPSPPREKVCVIGAGNMGGALLRGLIEAGWKPDSVFATGPNPERMAALEQELGIRTSTDNAEAAAFADVVVLGVKPQILVDVLEDVKGHIASENLVVSIAAGVPTWSIEEHLAEGTPVVRTMPNMPATVLQGATAMCAGATATEADMEATRALFECVGTVVEVDESLMDAVTGLSGTGPMYIFQIIEGLSDAGVKVGLSRHDANELAVQTVVGSALMAKESGLHPAQLKDMVTSPGGTAVTALHSLERGGLRALLIDAVEAATRRSAELGERYGRD
ncbi:MAG: pyrroline-5-carboxylate reductase [Candidatus Thermoplasmatota archaeon]|nr:pyrroline-5-carboxylate reductase [Candidatus Thermoplasmatota archaeon]